MREGLIYTMSTVAGVITPRGLQIKIAPLMERLGGRRGYQRFLSALTVTEKPQPGHPKTFARARRTAYRQVKGHLYVPRVKAPILVGKVLSQITHDPEFARATRISSGVREIPPEKWEPAQSFYSYQEAAADYVCDIGGALAPVGGTGSAYMQMETGMGKSRFGMAVAARGRGPVFVVVPTDAIRRQWIEEFKEVFPALEIAAYVNPPKKSKKVAPTAATHDVAVGIFNTVRAKEPGFFAGYATVILDEAHELHSPVNNKILWLVQEAPRVLGLSATPDDRADGLDLIVNHFLGTPICAAKDIPNFDIADVNFRGRVREVEYKGDPDHCETALSAAGTVSAIETIGNVIQDPARLSLVAAEVERLFRLHETEGEAGLRDFGLGARPAEAATDKYPEGGNRTHGIFVFAEHRDYLPALREALLERFAPEDVDVPEMDEVAPVVLRGGATHGEIHDAHNARIVLTTYGYSRRGVSIVDMTAIILATPRRHGMRQILGRVTRRGSDESILRIVVDIKDVRTALKSQNTERRKVYKEKEYPIYRVKTDYETYATRGATAVATEDEEQVWVPEECEQDLDLEWESSDDDA